MASKKIAVDAGVYERLAAAKHSSESFSKAIDRLLIDTGQAKSGAEILKRLESFSALPDQEADAFMAAIAENRAY